MIGLFASAQPNIVLHAEEVTRIGGVPITNSFLLGLLTSLVLIIIFVIVAKRIHVKAGGGFVSMIELLCEMQVNLMSEVMHSRKKALKYAPFVITLFCFILFNNWFGLLPGVGSIKVHGEPLFRAWTADLTGTLALSVVSIISVQIFALREVGFVGNLKHYFTDKPWNPINLFVGLLEVLGEFTRAASLALRLFGNIFAGEVLLLVLSLITSYGSPVATLPFILMELFVGFIQAFVFTTLVIVYIALAVGGHGEEHADQPKTAHMVAEGSPSE